MFANACKIIHDCVYGFVAETAIQQQYKASLGTAFAIRPGVLATASHLLHCDNDRSKPLHQLFKVICAPHIGQKLETATLIAEHPDLDIALLRITAPQSKAYTSLLLQRAPIGRSCGSLGFPLANLVPTQAGVTLNLTERFQGANISAYSVPPPPIGAPTPAAGRMLYETDSVMYQGSSGCPGFLVDGQVFGVHVSVLAQKASGLNPANTQAGQHDTQGDPQRLAISFWVMSSDIQQFAASQGL